jgi:hypothetical protein
LSDPAQIVLVKLILLPLDFRMELIELAPNIPQDIVGLI